MNIETDLCALTRDTTDATTGRANYGTLFGYCPLEVCDAQRTRINAGTVPRACITPT
jgi:hypothetical protein